MKHRDWVVAIALIVTAAVGLGVGYLIWGWPTNWYSRDVTQLPPSPENDVIRYGHTLIVDTPSKIGKNATDSQKRFAGNDLATAIWMPGSCPSPLPSSQPSPPFPCWSTIR